MQQSIFSDQKIFSKNNRRHIRPVNAQVQSTLNSRMKPANRPMKKKIKEKYVVLPLPVTIWMTGLILAGSEGALMPYLNIAGALIFLGASVWLGRILPCLEPDAGVRETAKKTVRHPVPAQVGLSCCSHDHGCTQGTHHLGMFGDKNLFFKGV
ncbi:MAG: hypothetical protein MI799_21440 [Desulfobacterales bacterium]|nr:hypothetical protein [Desulfobacterales bacterium]